MEVRGHDKLKACNHGLKGARVARLAAVSVGMTKLT